MEAVVKPLPGTLSVYAERVMGGSYLDFHMDREAAARYGIKVGDIQDVIQSAVGGMNVSWTVEGLERYPINVRYPRELRNDPATLKEVLVAAPSGAQVPLGQLAELEIQSGPPGSRPKAPAPMPGSMSISLASMWGAGWRRPSRVVAEEIDLPPGYSIFWSGQYEYMVRAKARLLMIVPITLFLIFLILYFHTKSLIKTAIVLSAVPVRTGGVDLADGLAGLQLVGRSLGRSDRAGRAGRRDRRGDAPVSGHRL